MQQQQQQQKQQEPKEKQKQQEPKEKQKRQEPKEKQKQQQQEKRPKQEEEDQHQDLRAFLLAHSIRPGAKLESTHTRIRSEEWRVHGGNYHIPPALLPEFRRHYVTHVFVNGNEEHMTEKQRVDDGPILVDFDFRFPLNSPRKYTADHIMDVIYLYLRTLKSMLVFVPDTPFSVFVLERPDIRNDALLAKDGIHMIIGIQLARPLQILLRTRVLAELPEIWADLGQSNAWNEVIDEGVAKGAVNWQMYGSQKPGHAAYALTMHHRVAYDAQQDDFTFDEIRGKFDIIENFARLSAQNTTDNARFDVAAATATGLPGPGKKRGSSSGGSSGKSGSSGDIRPGPQQQQHQTSSSSSSFPPSFPPSSSSSSSLEETRYMGFALEEITDADVLRERTEAVLAGLTSQEYVVREIHEYTQILPAQFYAPGSHLMNRKVAFALKHTDKFDPAYPLKPYDRLFLSWVMLRSKADDFDYASIPDLYRAWRNHFNVGGARGDDEVLKKESIIYWAKNYAPVDEYERIKQRTVDFYINETVMYNTDFDKALVLYHLFKDVYISTSCESQDKGWYHFEGQRWIKDGGNSLRLAISKDMFIIYFEKQKALLTQAMHTADTEEREKLTAQIKHLLKTATDLKRTGSKNNIMREAAEIFYDRNFGKHADDNKYLLCFTNGVVDFKTQTFRPGRPEDYITKCTNIAYLRPDECDPAIRAEVDNFFEKTFPVARLRDYVKRHLASTLIGVKMEEVLTIYQGSGSNGKSIMTDLMHIALGDYCATVPINYITEKRTNIGGTSSEIAQLRGVRYGIMNEPKKGMMLDEGKMKEATGGGLIQAREMYQTSETFKPQFSLVVCTNVDFVFDNVTDDGTWRRIKQIKFMSKFVSEGETFTDDTQYIFPKDKSLKCPETMARWAPVFMSMLVDIAFQTRGEVADCPEVTEASRKYRESQDAVARFIGERLKPGGAGDSFNRMGIATVFKSWTDTNNDGRKRPRNSDLFDAITRKFGAPVGKAKRWTGIKLIEDNELDDDAEGEEEGEAEAKT